MTTKPERVVVVVIAVLLGMSLARLTGDGIAYDLVRLALITAGLVAIVIDARRVAAARRRGLPPRA